MKEMVLCPVCNELLEKQDAVYCPECASPYHRECFLKVGKCIRLDVHEILKRKAKNAKKGSVELGEKIVMDGEEIFLSDYYDRFSPRELRECLAVLALTDLKLDFDKSGGDYASTHDLLTFRDEFESQTDEEVEKMIGLPPVEQNGEWRYFFNQAKRLMLNRRTGRKEVSNCELTYFTYKNVLYYMPLFSIYNGGNKSKSFNFTMGVFHPINQFFRKMEAFGIFLLAVIFSAYAAPHLLEHFGLISYELYGILQTAVNIAFTILTIFLAFNGNKMYFNFAVRKIRKLRKKAVRRGMDVSSIEYYHMLSENGGVSKIKGWFGAIAVIAIRVVFLFIK